MNMMALGVTCGAIHVCLLLLVLVTTYAPALADAGRVADDSTRSSSKDSNASTYEPLTPWIEVIKHNRTVPACVVLKANYG